jgi:hypothetical protein
MASTSCFFGASRIAQIFLIFFCSELQAKTILPIHPCKPIFSSVRVVSETEVQLNCDFLSQTPHDKIFGLFSQTDELVGLFRLETNQESQNRRFEDQSVKKDFSLGLSMKSFEKEHSRVGLSPAEKRSRENAEIDDSMVKSRGAFLRIISSQTGRLFMPSDRFFPLHLKPVSSLWIDNTEVGPESRETRNAQEARNSFRGTTFLTKVLDLEREVSARYKPIFTQGTTIGSTAHTLYEKELFFSLYGTLGYGVTDWLSLSSNLLASSLGSPNGQIKARFFRGSNQTWATSVNMVQERGTAEKLFNIDLIWDSVLSEKLIAHSLISAAVISFDSAKDISAIKSYGSSSFQTGYEYIFDNWSRLLVGPSYNIDKRALGGYIGFLKIFDYFHLQLSLTSNNVRRFQFSTEEGYLVVFDAYWRW